MTQCHQQRSANKTAQHDSKAWYDVRRHLTKDDSNNAAALRRCAASKKRQAGCKYLVLVGVEGVGGDGR